MLGIVFVVMGLMQALMLPMRGVMNWAITAAGVLGFVGGAVVALSARLDRSVPANEKRIPSARVYRGPGRSARR